MASLKQSTIHKVNLSEIATCACSVLALTKWPWIMVKVRDSSMKKKRDIILPTHNPAQAFYCMRELTYEFAKSEPVIPANIPR